MLDTTNATNPTGPALLAGTHHGMLRDAVGHFARGDAKAGQAALRSFPALEVGKEAADLRTFLFLKALWSRCDGTLQHEGNLYLRSFSFSQIELFNLLGRRMPLVYQVAAAANEALGCLLGLHDEATLIDVGTGTGRQIASLLEDQSSVRRLRRLRVVGIEPSESSLVAARDNVLESAARVGATVEFVPVLGCAESLAADDWRRIAGGGEPVIVNGAFALHHVRTGALKDQVLQRIADLDPVGFVLSEPSSNHESEDLSVRFENAWNHYGLVFDVIDRQPLSRAERDAMKVHFFAREIDDVVGAPEEVRTERHETAAMWMDRLRRVGLAPLDELLVGRPGVQSAVECVRESDHVSFGHRGQSVVALLAAAPWAK